MGSQSLSTTTYVGITDLPHTVSYGNESSRRYTYDAQYRLSAEYMGDTQTAAYTYDKLDRLIRFDDLASGICWEFSYDLIGRTTGIYASDGRYVGYQYDSFNRLVKMKEYVGGKVLETGYHYDDQSNHSYKTGLFRGIFLNGQRQIAYSYDDMSRRDKRVVMTAVPFVTEYTYYDGATAGTTSTVVKTLKNGSTTWEYAYDAVGNITSIKENGTVVESYGYDALNQLTTVVRGADTYSYSYDASGNITAVTKNGGSYKSYAYGNSNWKDLLTAYNGTTITYDAIGNPLTYRDGFTFTWSNGRQLATAAKGGNTYSYTYDASGLRTSKTVGNTTTQYYWLGDKLQAQRTGNDYLIFLYDEASVPYGLIHKYGGTEITYYYEYNLQGDIIGIISDAGTRVVTYQYSAWGELLSISGSMATSIGAANPLRYRGYYYDEETGFYYLQSRYYDPITCRFINADNAVASVGGSIQGNNMFAYCMNNPVNMIDSAGNWPQWIKDTANWVDNNIIEPIERFVEDVTQDIQNFDINNQSEENVFESNYFSNYKGTLVIKTPFDASFSFGFIGLSSQQQNSETLKHEYGHTIQLENMGVQRYITNVVVPSVTINILDRQGKLPYDYYSYPWEAEANQLGGVILSQSWKPTLPQDGYNSYWNLIQLLFE